ncbi:hypothetical protein BDW74DRAFT_156494 [Aspergillus multicolor]|uniref:uncharacterized protein n=1 Tax=Aspergillus multicolor TaxID=41759 RepID=UPI003CCDEB5B
MLLIANISPFLFPSAGAGYPAGLVSQKHSFSAKAVATLISSLLPMIALFRLQRYLRNIYRNTSF